MNQQALLEKAIADYCSLGWQSKPDEIVIDIARKSPDAVLGFAQASLEKLPDGPTFFYDALSFLPERDWPALIQQALDIYNPDRANAAADAVFSCASLQHPHALHPHLEQIYRLRPNADTYYENWPWRESATAILDLVQNVEFSPKLFEAALEARDLDVMEWCIDHAESFELEMDLGDYLTQVGFAFNNDSPKQLYSSTVYHMTFEPDYFPSGKEGHFQSKRYHPTWTLTGSTEGKARFGGTADINCENCGRQKAHLITLDPIPPGIAITSAARYELNICLRCVLGFESAPLRETEVSLVSSPKRWKWQDWGLSNGRENLHRVGGFPTWVQCGDYSACSGCQNPMTCVLQVASELPCVDGSLLFWGDLGVGYGLWCNQCQKTSFIWQCT